MRHHDRREVIHTRKAISAPAGTSPSAAPAARPASGLTPSGAAPLDGRLNEGGVNFGKLMGEPAALGALGALGAFIDLI